MLPRGLVVLLALAAGKETPLRKVPRYGRRLPRRGGGLPWHSQLAGLPGALIHWPLAAGRGLAGALFPRPQPEVEIIIKEESTAIPARGVAALAGGFIVHMVLGTLYCWGNFIAYAPAKFQHFDPTHPRSQPDALGVVPLTILFQTLGLPLGAELSRFSGEQVAAILGGLTVALGVFASSFAPDLATFMVLYGAVFGLGVGIGYTAPMSAGWSWLPNRKGLVNGLVLLGFGTGGFMFNLVGSKLINPRRLAGPPFDSSVYDAFPSMLRTLAVCYAAATLVGGALMRPKPLSRTKPQNGVTVADALASKTFRVLYVIIATTASAGLTSASIYKLFASSNFDDDSFLAVTGALGALSNGFGRLVWAATVDLFGFKKPFAAMLLIQTVNTALTPAAASYDPKAFLASTCISFFCLGGTFSMAPTCCAAAFGPKNAPRIYGLLFSAFAIASLGGVHLAKQLVPIFGWTPVYQILAAASLLPLALLPQVAVP